MFQKGLTCSRSPKLYLVGVRLRFCKLYRRFRLCELWTDDMTPQTLNEFPRHVNWENQKPASSPKHCDRNSFDDLTLSDAMFPSPRRNLTPNLCTFKWPTTKITVWLKAHNAGNQRRRVWLRNLLDNSRWSRHVSQSSPNPPHPRVGKPASCTEGTEGPFPEGK